MSKIEAFIQPEIEVFLNGNAHISIQQEACEGIGTYSDQLVVIHPANAERLIELIREAVAEAIRAVNEDSE